MKLSNSSNWRTHPALPSNEAEAAIEAARQEVAIPSEAEKRFAFAAHGKPQERNFRMEQNLPQSPRCGVTRSPE